LYHGAPAAAVLVRGSVASGALEPRGARNRSVFLKGGRPFLHRSDEDSKEAEAAVREIFTRDLRDWPVFSEERVLKY
jgi:hypothetical protein